MDSKHTFSRPSFWGVPWWWLGVVSVFYWLTHLFALTKLPVFADEAIYIRWSQLIIDDWSRYLFFPLNDGKTPLFMWLLVPWQLLLSGWRGIDQLGAARWLSVLLGWGQVLSLGFLVRALKGRWKTAVLAMFLGCILPFWFFHARVALIDTLLVWLLTLVLLGLVQLAELDLTQLSQLWQKKVLIRSGLVGVLMGLALWTKIPAILWLPCFFFIPWLMPRKTWQERMLLFFASFSALGLSILFFLSLKLSPAFPQLFARGSDFLWPIKEVFLGGKWQDTIRNVPTYWWYLLQYLTWPVLLAATSGLFARKFQRAHHFLWACALGYMIPIAILGKVVYPRYFLPLAILFTTSAALALEEISDHYISKAKSLAPKLLAAVILGFGLVNVISVSAYFMMAAWVNPNALPLVSADTTQYLTEWSSGHGIIETAQLITTLSQDHSVAVATEGYFGTLPDGLTLYFHRRDVSHIFIDGIGQPVAQISPQFIARAQQFDQVLLVVNSHRLKMQLPANTLLAEYCRPFQAPCLQVWDITQLVHHTPYSQNP